MKSLRTFILLACSLLLISACSDNRAPELNKHYTKLPNDISYMLNAPVVEVFSLTCSHCLKMEESIPEIENEINQPIDKVHVIFNENTQMAAMLYYSAKMQLENGKVSPEMMQELFDVYHGNQDQNSEERTKQLKHTYEEQGIMSPYDFSPEQQQELFGQVGKAVKISEKGMIDSVPTFIVNGKYRVLVSAHNDAHSIANTINYLLTQG